MTADPAMVRRGAQLMHDALGPVDDFSAEARNTIANIYYRAAFIEIAGFQQILDDNYRRRVTNCTLSYPEFFANAKVDFDIVADQANRVRAIKKSSPEISHLMDQVLVDDFKWRISNPTDKSPFRRWFERQLKSSHELSGLYDEMAMVIVSMLSSPPAGTKPSNGAGDHLDSADAAFFGLMPSTAGMSPTQSLSVAGFSVHVFQNLISIAEQTTGISLGKRFAFAAYCHSVRDSEVHVIADEIGATSHFLVRLKPDERSRANLGPRPNARSVDAFLSDVVDLLEKASAEPHDDPSIEEVESYVSKFLSQDADAEHLRALTDQMFANFAKTVARGAPGIAADYPDESSLFDRALHFSTTMSERVMPHIHARGGLKSSPVELQAAAANVAANLLICYCLLRDRDHSRRAGYVLNLSKHQVAVLKG